jgi:ribulose-5-phosphate 4-epimerase/fuculose-1-phosphate aldolase
VSTALSSHEIVADLVIANHILYDQGVVDGFGHISVRHPEQPDRFLLSRSSAPSLVQPDDIVEYDLDSNPVNASGVKSYLERFIHGEIYRTRPDVMSVVHSHSPSVIPFAVSSVPLRPVYHMAGFLRDVRKFEIRAASGRMTNMLVSDAGLGRSLAEVLGDSPVVLMRGHGVTAVGSSLKEAVFRAIYTEINARVQIQAIGLGGDIEYLSPQEAALAEEANSGVYDRPWQLWKRRVVSTAGFSSVPVAS